MFLKLSKDRNHFCPIGPFEGFKETNAEAKKLYRIFLDDSRDVPTKFQSNRSAFIKFLSVLLHL